MHTSLSCIAIVLLLVSASQAQTQPAREKPVSLADSLYWLTSEKMLKELEILPSQKEKLEKLRRERQAKTSEAVQKIDSAADIPQEEKEALRHEAQAKVNDAAARDLENILLPHQVKRLRQIALQRRLGGAYLGLNVAASLGSEDLAEELGITDKQWEDLTAKEQEVHKEMQAKAKEILRELQDEAREKLFKLLTPRQRAQLKEMMGPKFVW